MKPLPRTATITAIVAGVLLMPASAFASGPPDEPFGQHIRACAQSVGLSGSHNPGMHRGVEGWDGMPCAT